MCEISYGSPATCEEFRSALLHFINVRLPELRELKFQPDVHRSTLLFESGPIDSLGILHLIAFVENATGRKIPTKMVTMQHFRTVDTICETFWTPAKETPR